MTLEQKEEKLYALIDDLNILQKKSNKLLEEFSASFFLKFKRIW